MLIPQNKNANLVIIFVTSLFLFGYLYLEYNELKNYMRYIAERGRTALFHEQYVNKSIALDLTKSFSVKAYLEKKPSAFSQQICANVESINDVYGLNLTQQQVPYLSGTLQTKNPVCMDWARDVPYLSMFNNIDDRTPEENFTDRKKIYDDSIRYYIDLENQYIYINRLIDARQYTFRNWLVLNNDRIDIDQKAHSISIDDAALKNLRAGKSILSHIYKDGYTHKNIISMITPIFVNNDIKGIIISDVSIENFATSFYTPSQAFLWRFITLYVQDRASGEVINFHQPALSVFNIISNNEDFTRYYTVNVLLDVSYFLLITIPALLIYLLVTALSCRYVNHYISKHRSLSKENITDTMTGLYNRKVLSARFEEKIKQLIARHITVTVIAIDCDKLKTINDTLGHHMGDKAITLLGNAIAASTRKSDYGIRIGGDEFCIFLIDYAQKKVGEVITRIGEKLAETDQEKLVSFSYGCYLMTPIDTLETAQIKADALLYEHKKAKRPHSG